MGTRSVPAGGLSRSDRKRGCRLRTTAVILVSLILCAAGAAQAGYPVLKNPQVHQVSPNPAAPGALIRIEGTSFGAVQEGSRVLYDGEPMVVFSWSSRAIEAYVPLGKTNATYFVQVLGETIASNSAQHTVNVDCLGICSTPSYDPSRWNDFSTVLSGNNCYNYSNDEVTMTFAQPGRACGAQYTDFVCSVVLEATLCDGLTALPDPDGACPASMHRVHLVVAPRWDYHFYRQDDDGLWSHKPGGTQATCLDNSGELITDPELADTGNYTEHCGYLCACGDCADIR